MAGAVGTSGVVDASALGSFGVFGEAALVAAGAATGCVRGVFSDIPIDAWNIADCCGCRVGFCCRVS